MPLALSPPSSGWAPGKIDRSGLQRLENLFAKRSFWKATREEFYVVTPSNLGIYHSGEYDPRNIGTNQTVQFVMVY